MVATVYMDTGHGVSYKWDTRNYNKMNHRCEKVSKSANISGALK